MKRRTVVTRAQVARSFLRELERRRRELDRRRIVREVLDVSPSAPAESDAQP